jgi:isopenicillin-N N-acyltransferase-like protein
VRLRGLPYERGVQYGQQAEARVRKSIAAYGQLFLRSTGLDRFHVRSLAERYVPTIEALDERYMDELRGIAKGARVCLEDVLAINARTELLFAARSEASESSSRLPAECTAVAVLPPASASGRIIIGQNWDWLCHARETLVVLEVEQDEGPNFVTIVEAGLLAKFGLNSAGVGILTNALLSRDDCGAVGTPYHVVLRLLHDATSVADALARLRDTHRASSANYLLADESGAAVDVEALPGDISTLVVDEARDGLLVHTNHFTSAAPPPHDLSPWMEENSESRLEAMCAALQPQIGALDPVKLEEAFAQHLDHHSGVCVHEDEDLEPDRREATIASVVMDLGSRQMWIADGNPCSVSYRGLDYGHFLHG